MKTTTEIADLTSVTEMLPAVEAVKAFPFDGDKLPDVAKIDALVLTSRRDTKKLKIPRIRLTPPRTARRVRAPRPKLEPEMATPSPAPAAAGTEVWQTESLRGDTLQLYLREINRVKLLTPAEELDLARRVRRGDMAAREQMITANLRLVVKHARNYEGLGLPLLDLINEGNLGLMKGVQRYNPAKGAKLSSYASWWIKQSLRRALSNQSKTIRLPIHVVESLTHMRRAEAKLREALDREPTDDEVADHLGISVRRVRHYRRAAQAPVSLDSPVSADDNTEISEIVADSNATNPFAELAKNTDNELVKEVLATLNARENQVLAMRFGLDDGRPKTLEDVGKKLGVTKERIRQIQEQALEKMRARMEKRDQPTAAAG
jgi:RNA polymerase primary sigma factor